MKTHYYFILLVIISFFIGCKESIVDPPIFREDWKFPPDSSKFAITLYTEKDTIPMGSDFDVKIIFYNIPKVFGTAFEILYPNNITKINEQVIGPHFKSELSYLSIALVDSADNTMSFGITYPAGLDSSSSGSGVVMKLKCKAKTKGVAQFTINRSKLEIKKSNGSMIDNFNSLDVENLKVVIK